MSNDELTMDAAPEPQVTPEIHPLRFWAEKAGHLPESFDGDRMRPRRFNRKAWLPRAVCARLGLTIDSPIDERTYSDAVAVASAASIR